MYRIKHSNCELDPYWEQSSMLHITTCPASLVTGALMTQVCGLDPLLWPSTWPSPLSKAPSPGIIGRLVGKWKGLLSPPQLLLADPLIVDRSLWAGFCWRRPDTKRGYGYMSWDKLFGFLKFQNWSHPPYACCSNCQISISHLYDWKAFLNCNIIST